MKKKAFILFLIVLLSTIPVNIIASPVTVQLLSSNFHVWGEIYGEVWNGYPNTLPYSDSYNLSSTTPVNGQVNFFSYSGGGAGAFSSADFFSVNVSANAGWDPMDQHAYALAEAAWIFKPLSPMDHLTINHAVDWYCWGKVELMDLTNVTKIWSKDYLPLADWFSPPDLIQYAFQSNHMYQLYFWTLTIANGDGYSSSISTNDIVAAVPGPPTFILLFTGLSGLVGFRWKYIKKS